MPLARSLALRYRRASSRSMTCVQVASVGLVKAVDRWDPERGLAFSSYAVPTILGELRRYFRDATWDVRPARDLQELCLSVEDAREALWGELGRSPTVTDIAEQLDRSPGGGARGAAGRRRALVRSLDAPVRGRGRLGERRRPDRRRRPGNRPGRRGRRVDREAGTSMLDERSRGILHLRFGDDLLQSEIAERVGCSQMHVSRIIRVRSSASTPTGRASSGGPVDAGGSSAAGRARRANYAGRSHAGSRGARHSRRAAGRAAARRPAASRACLSSHPLERGRALALVEQVEHRLLDRALVDRQLAASSSAAARCSGADDRARRGRRRTRAGRCRRRGRRPACCRGSAATSLTARVIARLRPVFVPGHLAGHRERDGGEQGRVPGAEVLGREVVARGLLDVGVDVVGAHVAPAAAVLVGEQLVAAAAAALERRARSSQHLAGRRSPVTRAGRSWPGSRRPSSSLERSRAPCASSRARRTRSDSA